jgi:hypothetical protein
MSKPDIVERLRAAEQTPLIVEAASHIERLRRGVRLFMAYESNALVWDILIGRSPRDSQREQEGKEDDGTGTHPHARVGDRLREGEQRGGALDAPRRGRRGSYKRRSR